MLSIDGTQLHFMIVIMVSDIVFASLGIVQPWRWVSPIILLVGIACAFLYVVLLINKASDMSRSKDNSELKPIPVSGNIIENFLKSQAGPNQVLPSNKYWTCDPGGAVKLRFELEGYAARKPISVPGLLMQTVAKYPHRIAFTYQAEDSKFKDITYTEYEEQVKTVAKAFLKLGLKRFHGVCILGFNSPEWFISELATIYAGGVVAGIYTTNTAEACCHCLDSSRSNICVVEDDNQLQKILSVRNKLSELKTIVQYSGTPSAPNVLSWKQVLEIGEAESDENLSQVLKSIAVNECCMLLYTSGTEGPSKAAMLSHDNLTWDTFVVNEYLERNKDSSEQFTVVTFLPLSHVAAQIIDVYLSIMNGSRVFFADKNALKGGLIDSLKVARPHLLLGVPRVWEKIAGELKTMGNHNSIPKQLIVSRARSSALSHHLDVINGGSGRFSVFYKISHFLVYRGVKKALGLDRCKTFLSAAAPMSPDIKKYFMSFDIALTEGFGMSECGAHSLSKYKDCKLLAVGRTLPGCRTKIHEPDEEGNGELCLAGRHIFMGYLNEPKKTEDTFDTDRWLHTGDVGRIDENGFIYIISRRKEILVTSGGENVAPVPIENHVKFYLPVVSNGFVVGDCRKFLSLLITLKCEVDPETGKPLDTLAPEVIEWCSSLGLNLTTVSEILKQKPKQIYDAIQKGIDKVNNRAPSNPQRIQKFAILPIDFSQVNGELGPTMKLKRQAVLSKYAALINKFYE